MRLRVITPEKVLCAVEVSELTAPGIAGEFGVLAEHVSFLGGLDVGVLDYVSDGESRRIVVYGGYAEVEGDEVTVLADEAELAEEIDSAQAKGLLADAQRELAACEGGAEDVDVLLAKLARAEARVAALS
ncbi:MAG: ATP synthase F1 subunit epsilon [Candidatus Binatia bacterium]